MADSVESNPTLARRVLAVRLRNLRMQHAYDLPWLARTLDVALSQASRLDTGARGFGLPQVKRLCQEYRLAPVQAQELMAIAEEARKRAWWQQVELENSYRTLIGFEQGATEIAEFCSTIVPGLLQTREYAEAVVRSSRVRVEDADLRYAVDVRIRRQEILDRPTPPNLAVVIDEAALARGPAAHTMAGQLQHLLDVSAKPNVRVQVMPFSRGFYPVGAGQYMLLRLPDGLPDFFYSETQGSASDTSDIEVVKEARVLWNSVQGLALGTDSSATLIADYLRRLA